MKPIDRLKDESYRANMRLAEYRLADLTFGNVSVIDRDLGAVAIKPSGVTYETLRPKDMVVVGIDGAARGGRLRPSSDTPTHLCLYAAFPRIGAVVHAHSRFAVSFAQAGRSIPCLGTTHADYFHGEIPITRALTDKEIEGPYEWQTGRVIAERFRTLDAEEFPGVLVRGHGPFAWGAGGEKAVETAFLMERVAEMAYRALVLNPKAKPIAPALLDRHFKRKHGAGAYYGQTGYRSMP